MSKKKVAVIFGTRPDTIKLAPVIRELERHKAFFRVVKIATAQHRDMLDQVLDVFKLAPDYDLNVMSERQSLSSLTSKMVHVLDTVLGKTKPDIVLVQGDTTTTFVGSLAAFYRKIPVGHVEAGLRTNDKLHPFPEEMNRRITSALADLHFAPTTTAKKALLREGIPPAKIFITGNTVIDALQMSVRNDFTFKLPELNRIARDGRKMMLVTMHRRENWGTPMVSASRAIRRLAKLHSGLNVVFPVHLNPTVRSAVYPTLKGIPNVHLIEPLGYSDFVNLMAQSRLIITDSGGVQEEAPALGKPVLVLRTVTERPEAVQFGTVKIVGLEENRIFSAAHRLLSDPKAYQRMASATNPYGDGRASKRTVAILKHYFGFSKSLPADFSPK